jgi:hypothetical protein
MFFHKLPLRAKKINNMDNNQYDNPNQTDPNNANTVDLAPAPAGMELDLAEADITDEFIPANVL